jgi:hypothetical protein
MLNDSYLSFIFHSPFSNFYFTFLFSSLNICAATSILAAVAQAPLVDPIRTPAGSLGPPDRLDANGDLVTAPEELMAPTRRSTR